MLGLNLSAGCGYSGGDAACWHAALFAVRLHHPYFLQRRLRCSYAYRCVVVVPHLHLLQVLVAAALLCGRTLCYPSPMTAASCRCDLALAQGRQRLRHAASSELQFVTAATDLIKLTIVCQSRGLRRLAACPPPQLEYIEVCISRLALKCSEVAYAVEP